VTKLCIVLVGIIFMGGCSTASTIQKASTSKSAFDGAVFDGEVVIVSDDIPDDDAYRIFHQAATGYVSIQSIRVSSEKRANQFCEKDGKVMRVLREHTSTPPHILGNFPRIELVFACVEPAEVHTSTGGYDKYEQLRKLKSLLDDGVITEEEFGIEKKKLLK
jgi:hypothetical protein